MWIEQFDFETQVSSFQEKFNQFLTTISPKSAANIQEVLLRVTTLVGTSIDFNFLEKEYETTPYSDFLRKIKCSKRI